MIYIAYDAVRQGTCICHDNTVLFVADDSPLALHRSVRGLLRLRASTIFGPSMVEGNSQTIGYFTELKMMLDNPETPPEDIEAIFDMIISDLLIRGVRGIAAGSILA